MGHLGVPNGAVRASLYLYNTEAECLKLADAVRSAAAIMD